MKPSTWRIGPRFDVWPCLSSTAHKAGERLSALIAEITIETETATANCW
jgi:hypothetical protein